MSDKFTESELALWLNESTDKVAIEAYKYYKAKDYEKSLSLFQIAADRGDENGIFYAAYMLASDVMVAPDYEKAAYYYQLLVDKKNPSAMNNLAILYERGKGVEKDLKKAFELLKEATENGGNSLRFSNLAQYYFRGKGTDVDYSKALEAALKSCELGVEAGSYQILYKCYNEGLGTEKDASKAKHYRELALSADDVTVVIDAALEYINESRELLDKFKLTNKTEIVNKLQEIIERFSSSDGFLQSYLLAEIYYCLFKIQPDKRKEHCDNAMLYVKKVYEDGKELANHRTMQRMYGAGFFDFNIEYDYFAYDEAKFNGYTIGTTRITYVTQLEAKSNNYSLEYWLPRARLAYAMYCEMENEQNLNRFYENALSAESLKNQLTYKNIIYPNALYMNAMRYIMGYDTKIDENYGLYLLKLAGERYHSRGALLYGKACELKGDYENAFNFYKIAYSKVYPEVVKRKESLPTALLKPGEKITYYHYYEYGGEKKPCYEALENIILNYQAFLRLSSTNEQYKVFEEYLNSGYKSPKINEICEAFEKYSPQDKYERFIEANLDIISSPKAFQMLLKKGKRENAISVLDNILRVGSLDDVKLAKDIATQYGINEQARITNRLIELGDKDALATQLINSITDYNNIPMELADLAKEKNLIALAFFNENYEKSESIYKLGIDAEAEKCLEKYSMELINSGEYKKAKDVNPNLVSHSVWGYLLYNWNEDKLNPSIREAIRLLRLPNELSEKEIANEFNPKAPRTLEKLQVDKVIDYANNTKEYFKSGILLLSLNVQEGFLLLTKHYMNNTDNLLKLCGVVLCLEVSTIDKNIFSFNKAMCLYQKGGLLNKSKAKGILSDLVTLKHLSKLERTYMKPYKPAIDYLDGKEINEEYLLNIKK